MNSSLRYTGKVSITLGKRRSTIYNTGTDNLFLLFAQAIIGQDVRDAHPTEFIILDSKNEALASVSIQRKEVVKNSTSARFSGYLTKKIKEPDKIRLCKSPIVYAEVKLAQSDIETLSGVTEETSALIEWELNVSNKENEQ